MPAPLVIYHKQLGDVLLLEPALAKLAAASGSEVMLATRPAFSPMLSLMERVCPVPEGTFRRASQVVSFDPRSRACIQSLTTWAPEKRLIVSQAKYLKPWHALFFPAERRVTGDSTLYRAEYLFNAVPGDPAMAFRPPRLAAPPPDWLPAGLPTDYVLVHATSAWQRKCWRPEYWAQTMGELARHGIGPFVVTGGSAAWESEYVQAIADAGGAEFIDIAGRTSLAQYLAVVANARAVLCIDGSSSHLAAAFGKPAITLFGPSSPLHWHFPSPYSRAVDARDFSDERKPPAAHIPPQAAIGAFLDLIGNRVAEGQR